MSGTSGKPRDGQWIDTDAYNQAADLSIRELVRQQRQTEEIALRMFRFKSRRGIGVAYSFASVMVIITLIVSSVVQNIYMTLAMVAITPSLVIFGSGIFGYKGIGRMNHAIGLISGRIGIDNGSIALEILVVMTLTWPWLTFTALENFGYAGYAYVFPPIYVIELIAFLIIGFKTRSQVTIDWRIEDTTFLISICLASLLVIIPEIGTLGFELALPVWIVSGLKSLYDAPKEVLFEFETGQAR